MKTERHKNSQDTEKLKEITKWTQRYAENRTLPFLLGMSTCLIAFLGVGVLSYFARSASRSGNKLLFWVFYCSALLTLAVVILASHFLEKRLYSKEGQIKHAIPKSTKKEKIIGVIAGLLFVVGIIISVTLGVCGYIPIKYMQPVSAILIIPLLLFVGVCFKRSVNPIGFLAWLWPVLYIIHAILIVAGVPILIPKPWESLNIIIPMAGYGFLCSLLGHIYSRYALKKLKGLTHMEGDAVDGD